LKEMPFTWTDILLIVGLAVAATFFIFVFVNPPEALVLWMTGKPKTKLTAPNGTERADKR
jgi:hypothetical protein